MIKEISSEKRCIHFYCQRNSYDTMGKSKIAKALSAGLLFLVLHLPAVAANFVVPSGTKILDENGKELFFSGINLGNWLVWEGYLMMGDFNYRTHTQFYNEIAGALGGPDKAAEFEYQWRLNYVDEQAISDLSDLGFNSVRVPFNFKLFYSNRQIVDDGFEFFDRVINWCRTYGIYVLLDMHGAPGYQNPGDHADNVDSNSNQPRDTVKFWDGDNVQLAASIWKHIAARYKDEPVVWGYDLINEPVPQAGREYELLPSLVTMRNAIREVDNNHIIVAEGSWWSSDLTKIDWMDSQVQAQTGISSQWDDKLVYQIHHYGPASGTYGREQITNKLNIPLFIGEYGETEENNLQAITDWAKQTLEGYMPWSFKKMSHDRTLWTIPPNDAYNQVKAYINNGGAPPTHLYSDMISFAQINVRNGHNSHQWHQGFYNAIKPTVTCAESGSFAVPGRIEAEEYCGNQGVQVETTTDLDGGSNIGFLDAGDFTDYNIEITSSDLYSFAARVASQFGSGQIDVQIDDTSLDVLHVPNTNGWQTWTTVSTTLFLSAGYHRLRLAFPSGGFNLNWVSFSTVTGNPSTKSPTASPQIGCSVAEGFTVPGQIQAEDYCDELGVQLEITSDTVGGGQNIGHLDAGDFTEYNIEVSSTGPYTFEARVASEWTSGLMAVKVDDSLLASLTISNTGGWQTYTTLSTALFLTVGSHRLRLEFPGGGFNLNWISFLNDSSSVPTQSPQVPPSVSPVAVPLLSLGEPCTHGYHCISGFCGGFAETRCMDISQITQAPVSSPTVAPVIPGTSAPTKAPSTLAPTDVPVTPSPTGSPTSSPTASPPVTSAPTNGPTTSVPTKSPTNDPTAVPVTPSPTDAPVTSAPTKKPTLAPILQPTEDPPAMDCNSASSFAVPGFIEADQFCDESGLALEATSDVGIYGGDDLVQISNGDWAEYVVDVNSSGQYTFAARVDSATYSGQINIQINNISVLWLSVPHTHGSYKTISANVYLPAGTQRLRVAFPQGGFQINWFQFNSGTNNPP
mmetsp:Transcript_15201/g.23644  ORF Transcript_15201/g.23644 Transcript_15201/m.23644 type:complete len:1021 (-) Transcript_15201:146-3208(-)